MSHDFGIAQRQAHRSLVDKLDAALSRVKSTGDYHDVDPRRGTDGLAIALHGLCKLCGEILADPCMREFLPDRQASPLFQAMSRIADSASGVPAKPAQKSAVVSRIAQMASGKEGAR
ncbi:MAG: hypothetical protein ABSB74_10070 [Tepidisphaeraceae bacterium]|jgi:hypothetical protein